MIQDVSLQYAKGVATFGVPAAATVLATTAQPSTGGPPTSGTYAAGQSVTDAFGTAWICTASGTPGTWVSSSRDLNELLIAPTGATGETCPRSVATGSSSASLVSGSVYVRAIGLRAGTPVNTITLFNAAGNVVTQASLTHGWYALLDSTLHVLAVSADQINVAWFTAINTPYPLAVLGSGASTYITTYTGCYFIAESASVSSGAMPQPATSGSVSTGVATASPVLYGTAGSQAAPPSVGAQLASGAVTLSASNIFYAYTS